MVKIQIDIVFTILMIGYFVKNSKLDHFNSINQILKYLAKSEDKGIIIFEKKNLYFTFLNIQILTQRLY